MKKELKNIYFGVNIFESHAYFFFPQYAFSIDFLDDLLEIQILKYFTPK